MAVSPMREKVREATAHRIAPGDIPDEAFLEDAGNSAGLVRLDLRGHAPRRAASYLRKPENAPRWLGELRVLRRSSGETLAHRAVDALESAGGCPRRYPTRGEYLRWRGSTLGLVRYVEEAIAEAEEIVGSDGACPAAPGLSGEVELLRVRRYLVSEERIPSEARESRREGAMQAITTALAKAADPSRRGRASCTR